MQRYRMNPVYPVGIDFGNTVTITAAYQINEEEPKQSNTIILVDRNGSKTPPYSLIRMVALHVALKCFSARRSAIQELRRVLKYTCF